LNRQPTASDNASIRGAGLKPLVSRPWPNENGTRLRGAGRTCRPHLALTPISGGVLRSCAGRIQERGWRGGRRRDPTISLTISQMPAAASASSAIHVMFPTSRLDPENKIASKTTTAAAKAAFHGPRYRKSSTRRSNSKNAPVTGESGFFKEGAKWAVAQARRLNHQAATR
jgi:hypothetical protein